MNFKLLAVFIAVISGIVGTMYVFSGKEEPQPPQQPVTSASTSTNTKSASTNNSDTTSTNNSSSTASTKQYMGINADMVGMTKEIHGIVQILNESKGNVYFTLKDPNSEATIKGVLFKKTNQDSPERKAMLIQSRDDKSIIYLKGEVDIYKGELEFKTWQVYHK